MPRLFEQGNSGKPKGALNKTSQLVKDAIVKFLEDNVGQIQMSFDSLKPREKLDFIAEVLPYAAPKLRHTESELSGSVEHEIKVSWEMPKLPIANGKSNGHALQDSPNESGMGNQNGH